mmetsp:Transcript_13915/g.33638  ORF Transcript_13915/g.33638 Transcript_13915/m.33638 type:complete len:747 (-) Transcript_13915:312-2552(-)|eukprot:CAMPEP_0181380328 /NCGR_PEP_ID=MMETSP1106-20121128/19485_1 /TAXON_ID=81844 /ORGANISM="Mantoniella antarctica, Strain SL-175" /LENGTH=746 /DNA_ID=CAMNT_0023499349 /DNA_START=68 /DNA_END=2308 /DNA_ORIENTATION=-
MLAFTSLVAQSLPVRAARVLRAETAPRCSTRGSRAWASPRPRVGGAAVGRIGRIGARRGAGGCAATQGGVGGNEEEDFDAEDDEEDAGIATNFGDIDRLASEGGGEGSAEVEDETREWDLMNSGTSDLVEFGLSGRPLYVCQAMWWLRLTQLRTYQPEPEEVRDTARRSGLSVAAVDRWFADTLDHYHALSLVDKSRYDRETQAKKDKFEELGMALGEKKPGFFMGRDDDPVVTDAPWRPDGRLTYEQQEKLTRNDPVYMTMTDLPHVMAAEAAAAAAKVETEEGLDDDAVARIPQDGSAEMPFLINPYTFSKSGTWSIAKKLGPPDADEEATQWLSYGGWNVLPDHEIVSAVDGGALTYVGVNNDEHLPRDMWKLDHPHDRDSLVVAQEVDGQGMSRDAVKHIGDVTRKQLHLLVEGEELEGEVVALELYHGALVDCGCETDVLIPISEEDWPEVRDALTLGTRVRVRVAAVRQKWWRFRFPIEAQVLHPAVGHLIKKHPHEFPPISIYSGETIPFANLDAGRSMDRFMVNEEETLKQKKEQNKRDWDVYVGHMKVDKKSRKPGKKMNKMQKVLAAAALAAAAEGKTVAGAGGASSTDDEEEEQGGMSDGGAAAALESPLGSTRAAGERAEDQIAAEEEEEEAALFGRTSSKEQMAGGIAGQRREDPDAMEEGDDEETRVDTAADDNMAMNLNPEAEDTRGGIVSGVDDLEPAVGDVDDEDEPEAEEDDEADEEIEDETDELGRQ